MANPAALAGASVGTSSVGAGVSALGSLFGGQSQSAMYNYQAGVAQTNALLAQRDSTYAMKTGEVQAQQSGLKTAGEVAETKAGFGASNIDINSGSAARVTGSETAIGEENQAVIRANAAKTAYGFNVKAAQDVSQASAYSTAASTSQTAGVLGAVSSLVGGAGNVSSKWLQGGQYFGTSGS